MRKVPFIGTFRKKDHFGNGAASLLFPFRIGLLQ